MDREQNCTSNLPEESLLLGRVGQSSSAPVPTVFRSMSRVLLLLLFSLTGLFFQNLPCCSSQPLAQSLSQRKGSFGRGERLEVRRNTLPLSKHPVHRCEDRQLATDALSLQFSATAVSTDAGS